MIKLIFHLLDRLGSSVGVRLPASPPTGVGRDRGPVSGGRGPNGLGVGFVGAHKVGRSMGHEMMVEEIPIVASLEKFPYCKISEPRQ